MPLKVNVGLSRKVGESNYGSRGASVNVELELDSSLIGEPAKFHERIHQVYGLARAALNEELNGGTNGHSAPPANGHNGNGASHTNGNGASHANGNGASHTNGNGATYGNGNGTPQGNGQRPATRPATQSQVKAIHAIARNQRLDLFRFLTDRHGVNRPEDLDIKMASQVIDALKANGAGGTTT